MAATDAKTAARHLFRALLRAASYLPDEFAQTYIHGHIIHRFRNTSKISSERLRDARSSLSTLQRAASGDIKPLTSVLHLAYGRTGRRRRQLLADLLRAEAKPVFNNEAPETLNSTISNHDGFHGMSGPMFDQFLKSQSTNHPPESSRVKIRQLKPEIPNENMWGKPVPLRRQRSMVHKFWASTLNKILPPLPEQEWLRLRDLATGIVRFEGPPARRAYRSTSEDETGSLLSISCLKAPLLHSLRHGKGVELQATKKHAIDSRFMKRMWASVWNLTPMMSYNAETMKWTVVWGGGRSAASNGNVGATGSADLELFEGLEGASKIPKGPHTRPRRSLKESVV